MSREANDIGFHLSCHTDSNLTLYYMPFPYGNRQFIWIFKHLTNKPFDSKEALVGLNDVLE